MRNKRKRRSTRKPSKMQSNNPIMKRRSRKLRRLRRLDSRRGKRSLLRRKRLFKRLNRHLRTTKISLLTLQSLRLRLMMSTSPLPNGGKRLRKWQKTKSQSDLNTMPTRANRKRRLMSR